MRLVSAVVFLLLGAVPPLQARRDAVPGTRDPLLEGFQTPPPEARLRCYWWWLNGHTTKETITRDLTEMQRKGYGGVLLVDANGANQTGNDPVPAGPEFGSPAWTALYLHALQVAGSLGLEVTLNITSGWNLGGPWVKPENASKLLTWSRMVMSGGDTAAVRLAAPPAKNGFYRQIAVLAYPLHQEAALPGAGGSTRKPLARLALKSAAAEGGFSMPDLSGLLIDTAAAGDPKREADANAAEVQDVTSKVDAEGRLDWAPAAGTGAWEVLRVGYTSSDARVSTSSGAWQGLAIDYLDPRALDLYWKTSVLPLLDASRHYLGKPLKYLASDSWELGGTNWTGGFREEFRKRRGYDPVPYLPIVAGRILGGRAESTRFLADLRRTVADLVNDHYDHLAQLSKPFGLGIQCESGGPHAAPLDALETFRSAAIVQTEYWAMSPEHRSADTERFFVKEAASVAHIYGKLLAAAEGMTSIGNQWNESLGMNLKPSFDQALTEGMNRLVWHEFTSSPPELGLPGQEYFAGTHLNPNVTWWRDAGAFTAYLNRAQYLLQQGQPVADVLYYYGDTVPNFVRLKRDDPARVLPGYDYDVTDTEALLHRLTSTDGGLKTPEGIGYRALVLPRYGILPLAALEWAATYLKAGGILIGDRPLRLQGIVPPEEAARFDALVASLWPVCEQFAEHRAPVGKGQLFCRADSRAALQSLHILPDFEAPSAQTASLDFIHRRITDHGGLADIYFIRNTQPTPLQTRVMLRVEGRQPELLDAVTGEAAPTLLFRATADHRTEMPLSLEPYGSVFVVFRHPAAARHVVSLARNGLPLFDAEHTVLPFGLAVDGMGLSTPLAGSYNLAFADGTSEQLTIAEAASIPVPGPWILSFPPNWGAPASVDLARLISWPDSPDLGVRYFSGTATYRTTMRLTAAQLTGHGTALSLGDVHEVASVRINGKPAAVVWKQPWSVQVGTLLHPGENTIEIEVINLWPNRLIGDAQPAATKRYTWTNIRKYTKDSPLLPSGLLGPVQMEPLYRVALRPSGVRAKEQASAP